MLRKREQAPKYGNNEEEEKEHSETVRNRSGVQHTYFYLLRMTDTRPPRMLNFPPGASCICLLGRSDSDFCFRN
jgi:hypothetical protein